MFFCNRVKCSGYMVQSLKFIVLILIEYKFAINVHVNVSPVGCSMALGFWYRDGRLG